MPSMLSNSSRRVSPLKMVPSPTRSSHSASEAANVFTHFAAFSSKWPSVIMKHLCFGCSSMGYSASAAQVSSFMNRSPL